MARFKAYKNQYQKEMKNNMNKHLRLHCCQIVKNMHKKTKIQTYYNTKFNASKMIQNSTVSTDFLNWNID